MQKKAPLTEGGRARKPRMAPGPGTLAPSPLLLPKGFRVTADDLVPSRITLHPYGFYVVPTGLGIGDVPVRFHVWLEGVRHAQEPVWPAHSHRSTMTSYVLAGSLTNITWPEFQIGFGQPLYYVRIEDNVSYLQRTEVEVTLGPRHREKVAAGKHYVVKKGVFHDTQVPHDATCVTLCLFHSDRSGTSFVAGEAMAPPRIKTDRLNLSEQEAGRAHALCCAALGQWKCAAPAKAQRT